jgi:hypothetical protein
MKSWMVEQHWSVQGMVIPVRNVVQAKNRKEAGRYAGKACRKAAEALGASKIGATPKGDAMVLYSI